MKIKIALLACAALAAQLAAETVATDTAVFAQTDAKSAVIARLKAGSTITPVGEAPSGWRRVEIAGPFEAYVHTQDITKSLDVREGANIHFAPRKDAAVLTTATVGDKTELIGLASSDWAQIKLDRPIQGFIAVGAMANQPAAATKPTPSPTAPATTTVTTPGRPAPTRANNAELPRIFAGKLVVAKQILINPNPPHDYQIMDSTGRRFAYVDTKRLLLTERIETYVNRNISLTGIIRNTADGKDLVIVAESMKLN
jgi:uncharacterized protein YgiM (DUF1202 family)